MGMGVRSAMGWEWELTIKCMRMGVKTWELSPVTVNSLLFFIVTWSKGSNAGGNTALD